MNQIETARILIRPYRPSDADSVWQVLRRKEIYDTTYAIPVSYTHLDVYKRQRHICHPPITYIYFYDTTLFVDCQLK